MTALRSIARQCRRVLSGPGPRTPRWYAHKAMFDRSALIVSFYYIATAMFLYEGSRNLSHLDGSIAALDLLWPVQWLELTGLSLGGLIIAQVGLAAGLLGLIGWRFLAVRILVSIALLQYAAYENSHGAINHGYHEWFWISVCFWLLPAGRLDVLGSTRIGRFSFLTAFALAPALILVFYTLSGLYKTYYALAAVVAGHAGGFSPDAMAITVAWRAIQTGAAPMWAGPIIEHPLLGWPLYFSLYYVELVSAIVIFRPRLHRTWGLVLIVFHFGTLLFMDIVFAQHVLINGMLFVMSPFALGRDASWSVLEEIPILGRVFRLFRRPNGSRNNPNNPTASVPGASGRHFDQSGELDRPTSTPNGVAEEHT